MHRGLVALVGLVILLLSGTAFAQVDEAQRLKASADQAMTERRHLDALALYDRAYAAKPLPEILFNRGRALEALGRYAEALDAFERFDKEAPPEVRARVPRLAGILEDTAKRVATLSVRTDVQNARILVNGAQVAITPMTSVRVTAGKATLEILAEGRVTDRREIELPGGGTVMIDARLPERASTAAPPAIEGPAKPPTTEPGAARSPEPAPAAESGGLTSRWWFWTAAGVVVVGAAVTIVIAATTEKSADKGSYPPGQVSAPLVRF